MREALHERVEQCADPVAEPADHGQEADGAPPLLGRKLLDEDHDGDGGTRQHEGARHDLDGHEDHGRLREAREEGPDAHADQRQQEDPAAPDDVGEGDEEQRREAAEPDRAGVEARVLDGHAEVGRDLRQRGVDQPDVVVLEQDADGDEPQQPQVPLGDERVLPEEEVEKGIHPGPGLAGR